MRVLKTILFGYLGSALAGLAVGVVCHAVGYTVQDAALAAPYFGIAGGLAGAAYGAFGRRLAPVRAGS